MLDTGICTTCGAENVDIDPVTEQCADCAAALDEGGSDLETDAVGDMDAELVDEEE